MRPIDANALLEHIKGLPTWWADGGGVYGQAMKYPEGMFDVEDVVSSIENAPTLTQPNEWVRVEERLPEDRQIVLFHQKDGFIYCAEHLAGVKDLPPAWLIDNDCWEAEEVTHWMPLPKPPEGET